MVPSPFVLLVLGVGVLLAAACVLVARRQWFVSDDFLFLFVAQKPKDWLVWTHTFFPFEGRLWWSYRPLSIDVFFYLCFRAFGFDPFGYILVVLAIHFCSGLIVYRLSTQLGFDHRVAALTALLSVTRYPSTTDCFWISAFQHVGTKCLFLLTVSVFLDYVRTGRWHHQLASCATLELALLCNESAATLPVVLLLVVLCEADCGVSLGARLARIFKVLPQVILTAAYLVMRLKLFGPVTIPLPPMYTPALGWHIIGNCRQYLLFVFDNDPLKLEVAVAAAAAILVIVVADPQRRRELLASLLRCNLLCAGWILTALVPFVGFGWTFYRFAINIEAPMCLLFGAYVNALWQRCSPQHARLLEGLLLGVIVSALPYRTLSLRANEPQGLPIERFVALMQSKHPHLQPGACVVVLYGAPGLASPAEAEDFRFRADFGYVLKALYREENLALDLYDARQGVPPWVRQRRCVLLALRPGLQIEIADPHLVEQMQTSSKNAS